MTTAYKQLAEDYTTIVDYERKIEVVANKPSMVGKSYIDSIYLGTYRRQYMHIVSIKVFFHLGRVKKQFRYGNRKTPKIASSGRVSRS